MKQLSNNWNLTLVGTVVKTYFTVGVLWASVDTTFKKHRSEGATGFYSKVITAEIVTYMLLQHFVLF